jgi:LacI family transcriptional regulator
VAESSALSRRTLEKRFRSATGRTILEDIRLVRLERAKQLLVETSYSVSKVASLSGFGSVGYFIQFFQHRVGKTPRKYRTEMKT